MSFLMQVTEVEMNSPGFTILVQPYALGQYRIQITDLSQPDGFAPEGHGSICREL